MKRLFDLALLCAMIVLAFYACSEDVFSPYEGNLVFNSNDPRLEMIASVDSAKRMESQIETLAFGESIAPQDQVKIIPIYSGEEVGTQFTVYVRIDYHIDSFGIEIKSTQTYLRANKVPYPIWEETHFFLELLTEDELHIPNSRTYWLEVRGTLDYYNMYIGEGGHRDQIPPVNQIIQL